MVGCCSTALPLVIPFMSFSHLLVKVRGPKARQPHPDQFCSHSDEPSQSGTSRRDMQRSSLERSQDVSSWRWRRRGIRSLLRFLLSSSQHQPTTNNHSCLCLRLLLSPPRKSVHTKHQYFRPSAVTVQLASVSLGTRIFVSCSEASTRCTDVRATNNYQYAVSISYPLPKFALYEVQCETVSPACNGS